MDPTAEITEGVQHVSLQAPAPRKKKTARAYHNLTPAQPNSATFAQPQFSQPSNAFQSPSPSQGMFSSVQNGFNPMATPPVGAGGFGPPAATTTHSSSTLAAAQAASMGSPSATTGDSLDVTYGRHVNQEEFKFEPFKSFHNVHPPTSVTRFQAIDQGVAVPKFSRLSMYAVPDSETLRASTKLPLGLTVRPFAPLDSDEEPIPEIDFTDSIQGPPRCRRCRTYVNPAMKFTHDNKYVCNMCNFASPCDYNYQCPLDVSGRRIDVLQRPELHKGVVDFVVPSSYWVDDNKAPEALHHLFVIDVTATNDVVAATIEAIRSALMSLPPSVRVGIMTYNKQIQFYNLDSERTQVIVASDLEDPFVPIHRGLFVDPQEHSQEIYAALNHIEQAYVDFKGSEVAYGAVLHYALEALKTVGGGKITTTLSRLPTWGPGSLTNPDNKDMGSGTFKSESEFYQRLADGFIRHNVGMDLFVLSSGAVRLVDSANVVFKTAGSLKLYSNFVAARDEAQYFEEFKASVLNTKGYQAQLKVRCSNGLQVSDYYGNFDANGAQDPKLPILSSDQQVSVLFKYDSKLDSTQDAHFQTALLFTGIDGKRRVRVINTIASVTTEISTVFAFADQDTVVDIIVKNCLHYVTKQHPTEVKNSTKAKIVDILHRYRTLVSHPNLLPTQMIFPDSLSTLPAFINSFQKAKLFRTGVQNNTKVYDYYLHNSLPLERLMYHLYPAMINLIQISETDCLYDDTGKFNMPQNTRASHQFVSLGSALFVFTGNKLLLYIHSQVNPLLVKDLFGVDDVSLLDPSTHTLSELDTHVNLQARNIIKYFTDFLGLEFLGFQLVRQRLDGAEFEFNDCMVEDRALDKTESYTEFITSTHRQIREAIDNSKNDQSSTNHLAEHEDSTLSQRFAHI
ncbi:CYFA0S18e01244g1_1 [Cyberlindnera fabianii]|uniref:CYFA0S18e01244g1_1 n=1 Tax=Cyberlindnera fabianii TaxID=36022 RepID=A0A061B627_CYBFA|nr:CYFA0S18e01244g1_1 [Cyberlindnera fabianii]